MTATGRDAGTGTLPRHFLKPCLLLLLAEGPSHGYELLEHVRQLGIQGAEPGGLYRYLRAMEREELVSSWWEPSQSGPARRTYVLTGAGRSSLRTSVDSLREVRQLLVNLLVRYDGLIADDDGELPTTITSRPRERRARGATMNTTAQERAPL
ncbi:MAG: PadR family transcriptional regulator [Actinomycetota bacterium]|nr:PadR family transcriptional regulator [Actinomycetota bacterium]